MRKIQHRSAWTVSLALAVCLPADAAWAQSNEAQLAAYPPPYYAPPPSQSSVYNQNSVYLPSAPVAHGTDSVRGAAGVSCQSAVGSGGPYLDVGLIGSQDVFNRETASLYGRIVVPLGDRPKRPDCTKLYELEISRMRMELDLLRLGLPPNLGGVAAPAPATHMGARDASSAVGTAAVINPPPSPRRQSSAAASTESHETDGLGDGLTTIYKLTPKPQLNPKEASPPTHVKGSPG